MRSVDRISNRGIVHYLNCEEVLSHAEKLLRTCPEIGVEVRLSIEGEDSSMSIVPVDQGYAIDCIEDSNRAFFTFCIFNREAGDCLVEEYHRLRAYSVVASLDDVLKIAKYYIQTGDPEPSFTWQVAYSTGGPISEITEGQLFGGAHNKETLEQFLVRQKF